ncbi:hypothetical protein RCL1_004745 [Eukaryota sp. TZLM3-RCL]
MVGTADDSYVVDTLTLLPEGEEDVTVEHIGLIVSHLASKKPAITLRCVTLLRTLLARESAPPIDEVLQSGAIPKLSRLLRNADEKIQFETLWVLSNIASGTSAHVQQLLSFGILNSVMYSVKTSTSLETVAQGCWCLGNFVGDSKESAILLYEQGAVQVLINTFLKNLTQNKVHVDIIWAISNSIRFRPTLKHLSLFQPVIQPIIQLISTAEQPIVSECLYLLSYFTSPCEENLIKHVVDGIEILVEKLNETAGTSKTDKQLAINCIKILGNICSCLDEYGERVVKAGFLPIAKKALSFTQLATETLFSLSNVIAGPSFNKKQVIDAGLLPDIVQYLNSFNLTTRKEALFCLLNLCDCDVPEASLYVSCLLQTDVLAFLVNVLSDESVEVIGLCLDLILAVLHSFVGDSSIVSSFNELGALDFFKNLQHHSEASVAKSAQEILEYFEADDEAEKYDEAESTGLVWTNVLSL